MVEMMMGVPSANLASLSTERAAASVSSTTCTETGGTSARGGSNELRNDAGNCE
jgi:hypothetical protein